jgi:tRNA(adenine34) deaminase
MGTIEPRPAGRRAFTRVITQAFAVLAASACPRGGWPAGTPPIVMPPERRWYDAALAMQRLAESWGDQPYGAVLVRDGSLIGEGPSRVVKLGDASAHAEREAIRDAQRRLGTTDLSGSVLYSTSRPCRLCESSAAQARVARMFHGAALNDAGLPRP